MHASMSPMSLDPCAWANQSSAPRLESWSMQLEKRSLQLMRAASIRYVGECHNEQRYHTCPGRVLSVWSTLDTGATANTPALEVCYLKKLAQHHLCYMCCNYNGHGLEKMQSVQTKMDMTKETGFAHKLPKVDKKWTQVDQKAQ